MVAIALTPAVGVLLVGTWIWTGAFDWLGTLGPWQEVAESGRVVLEAASGPAAQDSALAAALAEHRDALSSSVSLARRWAYLGERFVSLLPVVALVLGTIVAWLAWWVSRRVARDLARPIRELVAWADDLAHDRPLPGPERGELREVDEVRVLRSAFRRASRDLEEARRDKLEAERLRIWGEMARRVAHEMKNPLTPMRLASHRLARSIQEDELSEPIAVILEEIQRLEELAQQFAALGRPPDGPTSPVDLVELLGSLLRSDVPTAVETSLVALGEVPLVDAHYDALLRAFRNLVGNAVEAMEGREGPRRVDVRIEPFEREGADWIEIQVADRGAGLPTGAANRIFEPDFTTKSRGTGLGLTLVRQTVRAHGGEVEARDREGGGAVFVVRIPTHGARPLEPAIARA